MSRLYKRAWRAQIVRLQNIVSDPTKVNEITQTIERLRFRFQAHKSLDKDPNTCDLKITNLSKDSRGKLSGQGLRLILEAGYENNRAIIFSGDVRTIDHPREKPDWVTHIQCGDGEKVSQFGRISQSFAPGASLGDVIRACAKATGLNLGNLETALGKGLKFDKLTQGAAVFGRASDAFNKYIRSAGFEWSVQQGAIQVTKAGQPVQTTAFLLTPDTGLVGSPDHTPPDKKGKPSTLKFKCLLNPQIAPGQIVRVEADNVNGEFVVQKLTHEGDTHGETWFTSCEALART